MAPGPPRRGAQARRAAAATVALATVAALASLAALALQLQRAPLSARLSLLTGITGSPGSGAESALSDSLTIDEELRADIVRLQRATGTGTPGHRAGARAAAKTPVDGQETGKTGLEKEMDAMRRELRSVEVQLSSTQRRRHVQRRLTGLRAGKKEMQKKTSLSTVPKDKKHCLAPLVWSNGECKSSPRANNNARSPAQAKERGIACAGGEGTTSCREYTARERKTRERELSTYEKSLRESSDYNYEASRGDFDRSDRTNSQNDRATGKKGGRSTSKGNGNGNGPDCIRDAVIDTLSRPSLNHC